MMAVDPVQTIPPCIDVCKVQTVVVIFPCDIPQDRLITLDLSYRSRKSDWKLWVPAQPLGPKTLHAKFPEVPYAGVLDVLVNVSRVTFSLYPNFQLCVISPLETIFRGLSTNQKGSDANTSLACIAAYLLHSTNEKDPNILSQIDTNVCRLLQSQPSEWNLSSLIFGKFGPDESLLHLFVRCKLDGAASILLENVKGKEAILQQRDYKGKTPAELARMKGSKRIAELVDAAINKSRANYEYTDPKKKLKKSKSLEQEQLHRISSSTEDADIGPLPLHLSPTKSSGKKNIFSKMRSKHKKGVPSAMQPSTPTQPEDVLSPLSSTPTHSTPPESPQNVVPLPPRSPLTKRPHSVSHDPGLSSQPEHTVGALEELLSRCIYTASVLIDYHWKDSPFGYDVSLKRGDVVHVIKEMDDDLCQVICNNFFCTVPKRILAADEDDEAYVHMSGYESSDDYEEIEDAYDIPENPDFLPQSTPMAPVTEMQFKPPPMRAPIKTQDTQTRPIPGRLLPECNLSSSHDTGLNRLGMPRQASKGKLHNHQGPPSVVNRNKPDLVNHSDQPATRSPYEWRAALKSTTDKTTPKPPSKRIAPPEHKAQMPPGSDDEEYDDITQQALDEKAVQRKDPKKSPYEWRAASKSTKDKTTPKPPSKRIASPERKAQMPPGSDDEEYDDVTQQALDKKAVQRKDLKKSPYEWRAASKSTKDKTTPKPPSKRIASPERKAQMPPGSDDEEYDDVTQQALDKKAVQRKDLKKSPYEWRAALKSTKDKTTPKPPSKRITSPERKAQMPPGSDDEEYNDITQQALDEKAVQRKDLKKSPYEWRAALKSTKDKTTPKPTSKRIAPSERKAQTPADSNEEEYDDVTQATGEQVVQRKQHWTAEQPVRPPVPVTRAASCGSRLTRPAIKPRSLPRASVHQSPVMHQSKEQPAVPAGSRSSAVANLKKHFENT